MATTNGDRAQARACAQEVARWLWERRETCRAVTLTPEGAQVWEKAMDPNLPTGKPLHHVRRRLADGDAP